jgi:hypothetical protein
MARSFEQCVAAVMAAGKVGRAEALDMLQRVSDRGDEMRAAGVADPELAASREFVDADRAAAAAARIAAINSVADRIGVEQGLEQGLIAASAAPPTEFPPVPRRPGGVIRRTAAGSLDVGRKLLTGGPDNPFRAGEPPRPRSFGEGEAPSEIRMENLHPEDAAAIAAADNAITEAVNMRAGFDVAAQCLAGGLLGALR